ncbi:MAG: hypothetical protein ACRBBN_21380 [Methyloligellaceae bacterium]
MLDRLVSLSRFVMQKFTGKNFENWTIIIDCAEEILTSEHPYVYNPRKKPSELPYKYSLDAWREIGLKIVRLVQSKNLNLAVDADLVEKYHKKKISSFISVLEKKIRT